MIASFARIVAVATALFAFSIPLVAQDASKAPQSIWPQQNSDISADSAVTWGVLENGVRYVMMRHSEPPTRVTLRLYVDAGSMMEEDNQRGLAHFLEHMAFNGTKHHAAGEMVEYFQRIGMDFGNDTNAHTSWGETVYKLELPNSESAMMDDGMQMLRDYADGMLLEQKEIDDERGIILAEKRERDSVHYRMFTDALAFSLPDSLIPRRMTIGEESVISTATREQFFSFYHKWYTPERMVVIVVGDIEPARAEAFVKKYFGDMPAVSESATPPSLGEIKPRGVVAKILREPEAPSVEISISNIKRLTTTPDTVAKRNGEIARSVANAIIARRLQILAKQEGAPFSEGSAYTFKWLEFIDNSEIDITCPPERWTEALTVAEQEIRKALEHGFTTAEIFEAVANLRNEYDEAVKQSKSRKSYDIADVIINKLEDNEVFSSPETDLAIATPILDAMTPEIALSALLDAWKGDTRVIYVCGNLPADATDAQALSVYGDSSKVAVSAPEVQEEASFAYTDFGVVAKVSNAHDVIDLSITQIQLANGVYVNIKPTDFEKNVVHVMVRFGSGLLDAPKDKPGISLLTEMTFTAGGLKAHSADDIARIFAGKSVQVGFAVQNDSFALIGTTSPRDLQDELNLMTAYFVAPGYREEALRQARKAIPQLFMQLAHTPDGVMENEVPRFLANWDYRFGYPKESEIMALNMDDVRQWMDAPLSHSRMEVSVVGDIDVQTVIPMLARTFGALPKRDAVKSDAVGSRNISMPAPQKRIFEYSTELPKAASLIVWPTADQWNVSRTRRLNVLSMIISDRMRIVLREKLGEAYSPYAMNSASDTYKDYGYMICLNNVNPDKVEIVAESMRKVGEDLAKNGITQDELDRALKPFFEQIIQQRRNNRYWLRTVLSSSQEYPVKLEWARNMIDDLHSITVDDINNLAAIYLQPDRAIDIHVMPVKTQAEAAK